MRLIDKLNGLGVAMVTPFFNNGEIDFESLKKLALQLIDNGVDYLVLLGTTAETPTLCQDERDQIVKAVVSVVNGKVPIVVGVGGPSTHEVVHKLKNTDWTGVDAILSVTPFYNRPSQDGLYQHFKDIAAHSPLPVILYTVMSRTSCNLEPETTLRLAAIDNIIGVKEASGNFNQIMKIIKHKPADFLVISGDDAITLPLLAVGINGLISVVGNAFPHEMGQIVHTAQKGDFITARKYHEQMLDIIQACFKEGSPSGVKAFLSIQKKVEYNLRLPLTPVSDPLYQNIIELNNLN